MDYKGRPIDGAELEETFEVPTLLASRFIVGGHLDLVRIVFGDMSGAEGAQQHFHTAVTLPPTAAYELYRVLGKYLEPAIPKLEEELQAVMSAEGSSDPENDSNG